MRQAIKMEVMMLKFTPNKAIFWAIMAAVLFGISSPISKILLKEIPPTLMAALLYLGAGIGISFVSLIEHFNTREQKEARITRKDSPFIIGMIVLDIAAAILLMAGLRMTTSANASLLNNFEIVATALVALFIFQESISKRLWVAIGLITLSSLILSVEGNSAFSFSFGSVIVLLACICWGFENNCTRMLSIKDPLEVVMIKGFGSGLGSLLIVFLLKEQSDKIGYIAAALVLGFVAYGLSIFFYVSAQRELGAARTSAFYAISPFIGVGLSFVVFKETPSISFMVALLIMIAGAYFACAEKHNHLHKHEVMTHEHRHNHTDGHHNHMHEELIDGEHCHTHTHEALSHTHSHTPDIHHSHAH